MTWARTSSASQRGYGTAHQKRRKALLPYAIGKLCPMCGQVMQMTDKLDLDHSTPLSRGGSVGDRIVHRTCNQTAGAELGRETQRINRIPRKSRDW